MNFSEILGVLTPTPRADHAPEVNVERILEVKVQIFQERRFCNQGCSLLLKHNI